MEEVAKVAEVAKLDKIDKVAEIRRFLGAVRRRALLTAVVRAGLFTTAALLVAALLLALCALGVGPAAFWPAVTAAVAIVVAGLGLTLGWLAPWWRLRGEHAVASFVGRRHAPVASDLMSAVELAVPAGRPIPHGGSPTITAAFHAAVAEAVGGLDPRRLAPLAGARGGALAMAAAALSVAAAVAWAPAVRRGLGLLVRTPTRFEGASVAREPLIGDVRLVYRYPRYTGIAERVVEGSTGDIVALKGARVRIEALTLRSARDAVLLLGDAGDAGEIPAALDRGRLVAELTLREGGSYRVWLAPLLGRPVREARPHRIVVEADRPPEVDVLGPADKLELQAPRPVEVGYAARDDFGLGAIDLVYRVDDGPEQRIALKHAAGARTAKDRTIFDPAKAGLRPGARVAYRIEAKDRDDVSGAKTGSSRTLYLTIENPRESLDQQLAREKEVLDKLIVALAERLEVSEVSVPAASASGAADVLTRLMTRLRLHENEEAAVALLGRVVDEERRAGTASKALVAALAGIAERLGRQLRDEAALLQGLRAKADNGTLGPGSFMRLQTAGAKHVRELESAVLLLDDLIGRQRLEDLAALGRDLTASYKRLQDLLTRYTAARDEALRRPLEREIRDLRARIEEMARKIAEVRARNEVPTEWQNMPDMREVMDKAQKLDQLLDKGDPQSLSAALSELGRSLESLQRMLDGNADEFGAQRFGEESRMASELMKKVGDLEGDQRQVAGDSQSLAGEVDAEIVRRLQDRMARLLEQAQDKAERLGKKVGATPSRDVGPGVEEELGRARERAKQIARLLPAGEWDEAKKETDRVAGNLRRLRRSLDQRGGQRPSSPQLEAFSGEMADAAKLAEELAADLDALAPRPETAMSPAQRERGRGLGERQGSLEQRTRELSEEMRRRAGQVPGGDKAGLDLESIAGQMGQAAGDLARGGAKEGAGKASDAADRLAKLREAMGRRQIGSSQCRNEPVPIPGADDSKAPREWRQELLEAMRERPPERFREEVRRYYEDLVK